MQDTPYHLNGFYLFQISFFHDIFSQKQCRGPSQQNTSKSWIDYLDRSNLTECEGKQMDRDTALWNCQNVF